MVSNRRSFLVASAGVAGSLCFARVARADSAAAGKSANSQNLPRPPLLGNPAAPHRFLLWGSYTCVFTAYLAGVLRKIVAETPKVAGVEWHHFPIHPPDPALHVAGLAFRDTHFWQFTFRILYAVLQNNGDHAVLTPAKLLEFAKAENGDQRTLTAAYADKAKWEAVKADLVAGSLLGIKRTPALFYNGYFMTPNGLPTDLKTFDQSLRTMLRQG